MLLAVLTDFCYFKYVLDVVLAAFFRDSNWDIAIFIQFWPAQKADFFMMH
jgi:hypothetical protein